ncbi:MULTISPECIES: FecR family protein [Parabacteroides]|uniref:FecR family protein n=3 Tax=Parabacteroides leei TaxID=2939491 RepID=UPI0018980591|nr:MULTISPECIES: FecR family protein [Parabacteroides]MCL3851590.1 FecR family protein [Parabacteroides leei]
MTTIKNYKDFLQNADFILWRLTGDSFLETYWEEFIEENPTLSKEMNKAIKEFSKIKLNKNTLTETEYNALLKRIHVSSSQIKSSKWLRQFIPYVAAVCFTLIIGISFYFIKSAPEKIELLSENIIVGENLDEKDIYLITDAGTTTFSQNVHVQVNENGSTIVQEADGNKSTIIEKEKSTMNKLVVPYGKRSKLELSDGTKVWLNSGSTLEFPSVFTEKTRIVNLIGEMYIEVAKNPLRPFLVNTPDIQVKVYGTTFNISTYPDNSPQSVVLVEGSVGIKTESDKEILLIPNEMFAYQNHKWSKSEVDNTKYISWKDGYIVLDKTPIEEVLKQIERYYNLSFKIDKNLDLQSKTCTGKIYLSDNLDNIMTTISLLSSTGYQRDDKTIYININP